jgi:hypothetical protein
MKTALQEFIDNVIPMHIIELDMIKQEIKKALEKEKEQIIEAHAFGADDVDSNGGLLLRGVKNAIYYYNQTYNQNK